MTALGYAAQYGAVALLGAGVGLGEIVSRYKDRPFAAATSWPGLLYMLINAAASAGALGLILTYGWNFGASGDGVTPTRLLVAGLGAMAVFRTSLFTVRVGNSDVGVGPSTLLSVVLAAIDRGVDRDRAEERGQSVRSLMSDVAYDRAEGPLPAVALGLMQNLDAADQAALGVQLEKIRQEVDLSDRAKALLMGLALSTAVGPRVLKEAKDALGDEILMEGEPAEPLEELPELPGTNAQERAGTSGMPATPQTPS